MLVAVYLLENMFLAQALSFFRKIANLKPVDDGVFCFDIYSDSLCSLHQV